MKFEEALKAMREGKKVKLPDQDYFISLIYKFYFDGNNERPAEILSSDAHILREDWEIIE